MRQYQQIRSESKAPFGRLGDEVQTLAIRFYRYTLSAQGN